MAGACFATLRCMTSVQARRLVAAAFSSVVVLMGLASTAEAQTQWKWRDANGAIQYSDRPPPPGTPEQFILARPSGSRAANRPAPAAAPASAPSAELKQVDELDARKRKAEAEEKAKQQAQQKAEEERAAKARAENCERARAYQRSLNDGIRIARTNPNGEREILDDKARAAEAQRTQEIIQSSCR